MSEVKYWLFGRVKDGAKAIVLVGSYWSREDANAAREKAKTFDFDVTAPIVAASKKEAYAQASLFF